MEDTPRKTQAQQNLALLLDRTGTEKQALSVAIGRGKSYVFDYLSKNVPARLPEGSRKAIADYFHIDDRHLSAEATPLDADIQPTPQQSHTTNAILTNSQTTIPHPADMTRDLPLYGTVECGDGEYLEVTDEYMILRPPALRGVKESYAVRAAGESMVPRFFPGEVVIVNPRLAVRGGCDVIVQLHDGNGNGGIKKAMLKRYIKKTPSVYILSSYNPDYQQNIEIPVEQVKSVHAVASAADLLAG